MKEMVETREVESYGGLRVKKFGMKVNAKAFRTVIKNLYSRVIPSACRELGSNAFDSHIKAGKGNEPFEVNLPTRFDPTFSVRDYGVGLTIEEIENIYAVMFESTKDQSNDEVGKFGLGAKIPFAYGDIFGLTSWKNGRKLIYSMILDENSEPCAVLLSDEPSDEPTGVEVSFPVAEKDWDAFAKGAIRSFAAFPVLPKFNNATIENAITTLHNSGRKVRSGVMYEREAFAKVYAEGAESIWVRQGCVIYPIRSESYTPEMLTIDAILRSAKKILVTDVPIGDVEVTPNREEVIYDDRTVSNISRNMTGGARDLTADNLRLIARATLKSRWNIIDLYQARINKFDRYIMESNVGDPYPHLKVFGRPVCFWLQTSTTRLSQYLSRAAKLRHVSFCMAGLTAVDCRIEDLNDGMTVEDMMVRQKVSFYGMMPHSAANHLVIESVRSHKRPPSRYGQSTDFVSKPLTIVLLDDMPRSDREIAFALIEKYRSMGVEKPVEKTRRTVFLKNGTEKDAMMIWHFLGRPKQKPEIIRLTVDDVSRVRTEMIKTVVTYNSGTSRGVEVSKLREKDSFFVMISCEKGEKTLFGNIIQFNANEERRLRAAVARLKADDDKQKNVTILLVPPSKMAMTKEAFDGKLISAEEVLIRLYESIKPNDYDLCQFYSSWNSYNKRPVKYRGEKINPADREWVHLSIGGVDRNDLIDVKRSVLSADARESFDILKDMVTYIRELRDFMDCRGYDSDRSGFNMRPEDILSDERSVKWLKDSGLYARLAKVDRRNAKANWRNAPLTKAMFSIRKTLHRKNKLLALIFEHGNVPYLCGTIGGYSYAECVKEEVTEALEKMWRP